MKLRLRRMQNILILCGLCLAVWKLGFLKHSASLSEGEEGTLTQVGMQPRDSVGIIVEQSELVFREDFSFPQPRVTKELGHIRKTSWIRHLRHYLNSIGHDTKQIYLLTSNYQYLDVLLNWLISAVVRSNVTIQSVLTISMDYSTHSILQAKGFPSVFVAPSNLFIPNFNFSAPFERVMMLRLTLMRIISHFGFDVAMIDTDAIMLKNPQTLFDAQMGIDIIGSMGTIPEDLLSEWPMTICIGVVLVRSSEETEQYWNGMKDIHQECLDDQGKLNYGLKALDIKWHNNNNCSHHNTTIYGKTSNNLQVSILPYNDVCRLDTCDVRLRSRYYFWHKGGHRSRKKKLHSARKGNTWFLRYQWNKISNSYVGKDWLKSIAYMGATLS